jgi:hypothetical protein
MNRRDVIWMAIICVFGLSMSFLDSWASHVPDNPAQLFVSYARVDDAGRVNFGWSVVPCERDPPTVDDLNRIGGQLYDGSSKAGNLILLNFQRVSP